MDNLQLHIQQEHMILSDYSQIVVKLFFNKAQHSIGNGQNDFSSVKHAFAWSNAKS
jgi:hypothetical protein